MDIQEAIQGVVAREKTLVFVSDFLDEFPEANLYLVGGAVRDLLMKRDMPDIDYDFVIKNLEKEKIEQWFSQRGSMDLAGAHFGVFKFLPEGEDANKTPFIDIALPRTEASSKDSVGGYKDFDVQSDHTLAIEEDLARRDFTINAMAINMRTHELIDPFNGEVDLEKKQLRAVGEASERFQEDMSRMLRAIRFAAELNFSIEEETAAALKSLIGSINVQREREGKMEYVVPREVLGTELSKALERGAPRAVEELANTGAMNELFPHVWAKTQTDSHYLEPLKKQESNNAELATILLLRGVLHDHAKDTLTLTGLGSISRHSSRRIEPSNVLWIIDRLQDNMTTNFVSDMRGHAFEKYFMNGRSNHLVEALTLTGQQAVVDAALKRIEKICAHWVCVPGERIPPLVKGDDVIAAGVDEGPRIRELLDLARDKQLDGELLSRTDALKWIKENV